MSTIYDPGAAKKPTNVSINRERIDQARALGVKLSATLESALEVLVKERRMQEWLEENRGAIARYNEHFRENPVFSTGLRAF